MHFVPPVHGRREWPRYRSTSVVSTVIGSSVLGAPFG